MISGITSFPVRMSRGLIFLALGALLLPTEARAGACTSGPSTLCLQNDLFEVEIAWENGGITGQGLVTGPSTSSFGFFRYDDSGAAEAMVKVVDACALTGRYWVLIANVSDYGQTVTVTNLQTASVQQYTNPEGDIFQPIIDTDAFLCPMPFHGSKETPQTEGVELLLFDGRFRVEVAWEDSDQNTGAGTPVQLADRAGYFTFFTPTSPELLVKMTPGDTGFYAVGASSTSNVEVTLTVTDLCTGAVKTYMQPLGTTTSFIDSQAFDTNCGIFTEDFESGDLSFWTLVVGGP